MQVRMMNQSHQNRGHGAYRTINPVPANFIAGYSPGTLSNVPVPSGSAEFFPPLQLATNKDALSNLEKFDYDDERPNDNVDFAAIQSIKGPIDELFDALSSRSSRTLNRPQVLTGQTGP